MRIKILYLLLVLFIAAYFRFTGINWDQGHHLHPDERFLVMVGTAMKWPTNFLAYLDTSSSSLNPHNIGYDFYVYGTFPILFVKLFATLFSMDNYDQFLLIGRIVTAFFEVGMVFVIFLISQKLSKSFRVAILSAFVYATSALPIQLAHFFAVDTYLVFFTLVSLYFALSKSTFATSLSGIAFALALSSKVSGVILLPVILFTLLYSTRKLSSIIVFGISSIICFRFTYPYLFASSDLLAGLNDRVLANWRQLESFNDPSGWFPPGVQWISAKKYLFPFQNIIFWGLGLPLAIISAISLFFSFKNIRNYYWLIVPLLGIFIVFIYQGSRFAMPMRYFYPIYPFVAILVGFYLSHLKAKSIAYCLVPIALLLWPFATTSIYRQPHTRVSASSWILENIPAGARLSCEHWDDCLPLGGSHGYQIIEYPLYHPDSPQKSIEIESKLAQTDYLILTSNRLYGSITGVPLKYPTTTKFYTDLFAEKIGFTKIAEFTSRPNLPLPFANFCLRFPYSGNYGQIATSNTCTTPGFSFIDDYADESWTVYDHPKVTIFKRVER